MERINIFSRARAAVFGYIEQERSAYAQAVETAKQARLQENPNFPHALDCPRFSGLTVVPIIRIWNEADTGYFTNARCDDCQEIGRIIG